VDLKSGYPWWTVKNGLLNNFPALREDIECDVLVIGAGITGALIGWHLQQDGHDVCVVDRRQAGWGSTAASTALLQYEIDTELQDLASRYGIDDALLAYRTGEQAIGKLQSIARRFRDVDFHMMHSLYYASHWYHASRLRREAALRQAHDFRLRVLETDDVRKRFGFDAPVALLTEVAAEADPYQFAQRLLGDIRRRRGRVFDRTAVSDFRPRRGGVLARTETDATIRCRHLIVAAGYESQVYLDQRVAKNRSSYAFVTEPVPEGLAALRKCLVWESARPYLYLRRTRDERLLVGGEDDKIDIPARRDARVLRKSETLLQKTSRLFPALTLDPAFAWAGTFAETADGLPFFGTHEQHGPRVHFAMAYGGNGITYSLIGAELLRDSIAGRRHPCAKLFSFARLARN
jgi:glycine/D-amino acid oxidase-like deaminating enzyme